MAPRVSEVTRTAPGSTLGSNSLSAVDCTAPMSGSTLPPATSSKTRFSTRAGLDVDEVEVVDVVVAALAERADDHAGDAELGADAPEAARVRHAVGGGAVVDAELGLELLFAGDLVVAATGEARDQHLGQVVGELFVDAAGLEDERGQLGARRPCHGDASDGEHDDARRDPPEHGTHASTIRCVPEKGQHASRTTRC